MEMNQSSQNNICKSMRCLPDSSFCFVYCAPPIIKVAAEDIHNLCNTTEARGSLQCAGPLCKIQKIKNKYIIIYKFTAQK